MRRQNTQRGFTLVELLVVIGIIAVLISVLLPALSSARRSANSVKCQSNLRQLALAVLQYSMNNKNNLPTAFIHRSSNSAQTIYPDGFSWANALVTGKYVNAPNNYTGDGRFTFPSDSVFRCPEGIPPEDANNLSTASQTPQTHWPTNALYNSCFFLRTDNPRVDGGPMFTIASWYQVNARNQSGSPTTNNPYHTPAQNARAAPFMSYDSQVTNDHLMDRRFQRKLTMITRSAEMVMIAETSDINWLIGSPSGNINPEGRPVFIYRIGARHGKKSRNGYNAYTNIAFFDGHVEQFNTEKFYYNDPRNFTQGSGHIFYINRQK